MRLAEVRVEVLDVPFREPLISGAARWESHRAGILVLTATDGRIGLGEFPAPRPVDLGTDVAPRLQALLTGLRMDDPLSVAGTLREVDRWPLVGRAVRAALETAYSDLLAQARGQPVSRSLGAADVDVRVNAMLGIEPPETTAQAAATLVAEGYHCLKLKAGDEPDGALEARVAAVRRTVGPTISLRLDFNGSLGLDAAPEALAAVAGFDLEYVEQPIAVSAGADALASLRRAVPVPIAADESVRDLGSARVLLEAGAVDVLVVKPARVGGLRQGAAIIELATQAGVPVTVSTLFETGVGLAAALHLAAATPGHREHGLATGRLLVSDLLAEPLTVVAGTLRVPEGPGLGVRLDENAVARYRLA